jgi:DNA-binding MarR family transcriptional regulator
MLEVIWVHARLFRVSKQSGREQSLDHVAAAAAGFGAAADAVDSAVAAVLGVNRTDLTILGTVHHVGRLTAGDAATAARLSPAATSAAIRRLVSAGLLRREIDPKDRRRAALTVTERAGGIIEQAYGPIGQGGRAELERWTSEELAVIESFLTTGIQFQKHHAARIRTWTKERPAHSATVRD